MHDRGRGQGPYFARSQTPQGIENFRDKGAQIHEAVGRRPQHEHTERQLGKLLLVLQISVHRQKCGVLARRPLQQLAVGDAGPAGTNYRIDLVTAQVRSKIDRNIFVK
jgi:hypothetical protein